MPSLWSFPYLFSHFRTVSISTSFNPLTIKSLISILSSLSNKYSFLEGRLNYDLFISEGSKLTHAALLSFVE